MSKTDVKLLTIKLKLYPGSSVLELVNGLKVTNPLHPHSVNRQVIKWEINVAPATDEQNKDTVLCCRWILACVDNIMK